MQTDALTDEKWMREALLLAEKAASSGEIPVGAVVVHEQKIVGQGFNQRESLKNPIAHAEITAIQEAAARLGAWRLLDCTLYVTLEPCPMCAGAILNARIPRVVYGARDPKAGAVSSLFQLLQDQRLNHRCEVVESVCGEDCGAILSRFFAQLRKSRKT